MERAAFAKSCATGGDVFGLKSSLSYAQCTSLSCKHCHEATKVGLWTTLERTMDCLCTEKLSILMIVGYS